MRKGRIFRQSRGDGVERRVPSPKRRKGWAPRALVKRLPDESPGEKTLCLSHEALYRAIYVLPRGFAENHAHYGTAASAHLPEKAEVRKPRGLTRHSSGEALDRSISIEVRPREVADRTMPGPREPKDPAQ